jgi:hypothetical protein
MMWSLRNTKSEYISKPLARFWLYKVLELYETPILGHVDKTLMFQGRLYYPSTAPPARQRTKELPLTAEQQSRKEEKQAFIRETYLKWKITDIQQVRANCERMLQEISHSPKGEFPTEPLYNLAEEVPDALLGGVFPLVQICAKDTQHPVPDNLARSIVNKILVEASKAEAAHNATTEADLATKAEQKAIQDTENVKQIYKRWKLANIQRVRATCEAMLEEINHAPHGYTPGKPVFELANRVPNPDDLIPEMYLQLRPYSKKTTTPTVPYSLARSILNKILAEASMAEATHIATTGSGISSNAASEKRKAGQEALPEFHASAKQKEDAKQKKKSKRNKKESRAENNRESEDAKERPKKRKAKASDTSEESVSEAKKRKVAIFEARQLAKKISNAKVVEGEVGQMAATEMRQVVQEQKEKKATAR